MRQESKTPTEAAFATAFRAAAELGQVETAKEIFEHRIEAGLPPKEAVYVKVKCVLVLAHKYYVIQQYIYQVYSYRILRICKS